MTSMNKDWLSENQIYLQESYDSIWVSLYRYRAAVCGIERDIKAPKYVDKLMQEEGLGVSANKDHFVL